MIKERVEASTSADRQFVWGLRYIDDLVLRDRDTNGNGTLDERLYALQDANWNVTALVNTSGVVQERFAYSAYGAPLVLTSGFVPTTDSYDWETLFAGYRYDCLSGLCHVRNRMYHPALGTWLQRDPLGMTAGVNLYLYCFASPLDGLDPSGLFRRASCRELKIRCRSGCWRKYLDCTNGLPWPIGEFGCWLALETCGAKCDAEYWACLVSRASQCIVVHLLPAIGAIMVVGGIVYTVATLSAAGGGGMGILVSSAGAVLLFSAGIDHQGCNECNI